MILDEKFWLAVCFAIFVILAYSPIKKALLGLIDRRIELIKDELKNAKTNRLEAEAILKKSQAKLEGIISERDVLLQKARDDIDKISEESELELEMLLKSKERDVTNRLEQLKVNATQDLSATFTKTAKELTNLYLSENKAKLPSDQVLASHLMQK